MKCYPLILTLCTLAMVGCGPTTRPAPEVGVIPPGSFVKAWESDTTVKKVNSMYLLGDMMFLYGPDNVVVGFDREGGLKFRTTVGNPKYDVVGEPMMNPERVVFPTSSSLELYTPTGLHAKTVNVGFPIRSPGVLLNNLVYLGVDTSTGGRLAAVSLDKPTNVTAVVWTRMTQNKGIINTKPAVFENVIYAATQDGEVLGVTPDPVLLWGRSDEMKDSIFVVDGQVLGTIKVDEGGVFVPCTDSKLYCIAPATGKLRWTYYAGTPLNNSPTLSSDSVYLRVGGKGMVALDKKPGGAATREPRWTNEAAVKILADDAKYTYALTKDGRVSALDKKTGEVKFKTDRNDYVGGLSNMNPKDNTIFVLTRGGKLLSIKPVAKAGVIGELAMANSPQTVAAR